MFIGRFWRSGIRFPQLPVQKYLLAVPPERDSTFARLRRLFSNPLIKVQPFGVLALARGECPRHLQAFGFESNDETAKLLLRIVHTWILHRRMHTEGMDTEKYMIWEYLWVHMRDILVAQEIHELQFRGNLEEMQHKTLGFCLVLDESLDELNNNGNNQLLKEMLVLYFYDKNKKMLQSMQVHLLSKYILSMVDFIAQVPLREFRHAAFTL
eukprot:XP_001612011.1 hypothetical protein [Babesia bovis T2Bo]